MQPYHLHTTNLRAHSPTRHYHRDSRDYHHTAPHQEHRYHHCTQIVQKGMTLLQRHGRLGNETSDRQSVLKQAIDIVFWETRYKGEWNSNKRQIQCFENRGIRVSGTVTYYFVICKMHKDIELNHQKRLCGTVRYM